MRARDNIAFVHHLGMCAEIADAVGEGHHNMSHTCKKEDTWFQTMQLHTRLHDVDQTLQAELCVCLYRHTCLPLLPLRQQLRLYCPRACVDTHACHCFRSCSFAVHILCRDVCLPLRPLYAFSLGNIPPFQSNGACSVVAKRPRGCVHFCVHFSDSIVCGILAGKPPW